MIDLHTHILPGVDDGVQTEDEAVEFARVAAADGIEVIVATPHCKEGSWFHDRASVLRHVERLRGRLEEHGIHTVQDVLAKTAEELATIPGIGPVTAEGLRQAAQHALDAALAEAAEERAGEE